MIATDAKIAATRVSQAAFARVCAAARSMWDIATKKAGSIDTMRGLLVPLRNVYLTVIAQMKEQEPNEASRLGLDIALAMVLATQSEDPKPEAFAFQRFRRFLWLQGEEPREFYVDAAT